MIEIVEVTKVYRSRDGQREVKALDRIDMTVDKKEFVALLGPSGCGKTTLLKIVGGLIPVSEGEVRVDGKPVKKPGPDRAIVFQNFALMPWANVVTNVAFGLELRGVPKEERQEKARALLRTVGLSGFEDAYPRHLSGGMQQRVGLARALAVNPDTLLMDEPFGALDAQTRRVMQDDLIRLHERDPKTVVFVTHSMDEAVRLADRILLMCTRPGRIEEEIDVPFGRPRPSNYDKNVKFTDLKNYLWDKLKGMQTIEPASSS